METESNTINKIDRMNAKLTREGDAGTLTMMDAGKFSNAATTSFASLIRSNSSCAFFYLCYVDLRYFFELSLVCIFDRLFKCVNRLCLNQVNRTASKSTTHHSGSNHAFQSFCSFHKEIQLRATDSIFFTQPFVCLIHQLSK